MNFKIPFTGLRSAIQVCLSSSDSGLGGTGSDATVKLFMTPYSLIFGSIQVLMLRGAFLPSCSLRLMAYGFIPNSNVSIFETQGSRLKAHGFPL
jgi:hypothetical protein